MPASCFHMSTGVFRGQRSYAVWCSSRAWTVVSLLLLRTIGLNARCIIDCTAPEPAHARSALPARHRVSHAVADGAAPTALGGTRARHRCETRFLSWRYQAYGQQCTRRALALRGNA